MGGALVLVAVDIGGTFTDVVVVDSKSGTYHTVKVPTTPHRLVEGVRRGALAALELARPSRARWSDSSTARRSAPTPSSSAEARPLPYWRPTASRTHWRSVASSEHECTTCSWMQRRRRSSRLDVFGEGSGNGSPPMELSSPSSMSMAWPRRCVRSVTARAPRPSRFACCSASETAPTNGGSARSSTKSTLH